MRAPLTLAACLAVALPLAAACGGESAPEAPAAGVDASGGIDLESSNGAPELTRIGDRVTPVGRSLVITAQAVDPDGDPLSFALYGALPDGARFDKATQRFEWTPTEAGATVHLTFVVTDGQAYDRETIRVTVVTGSAVNPPVFGPLGDRTIAAGAPFELRLDATDPDGDAVRFGHEGALPDGAALDGESGRFSWQPSASQAGTRAELTFTASDGLETVSQRVQLVVEDGSPGLPRPPSFTMSKAARAVPGVPIELSVTATDPNDDPLTFGFARPAPDGGRLDGAVVRWTPAEGDAGRAVPLVLSASDGVFTAVHVVTVSIERPAAGACSADPNEPNDREEDATAIPAGGGGGFICDTPESHDTDYWKLDADAEQTISLTLDFDERAGDLDLYLLAPDGDQIAQSLTSGGREELRLAAPTRGTYTVVVIGYSETPLAVAYTLTGEATTAACREDAWAGNHTPATAAALTSEASGGKLQLCAGQADYWTFEATCGARIEALLAVDGEADLDLYVYDSVDGSGPAGREPVGASLGDAAFEEIVIPAATRSGTHLIEVASYPNNTLSAAYELVVTAAGRCTDDALGNDSRGRARTLGLTETRGVVCCGEDWFKLELEAGNEALVAVAPSGGRVGVTALRADGVTAVDSDPAATTERVVVLTSPSNAIFYVRVTGDPGATYAISAEVY
jgi:hypothetical protein